MLRDSLRGSARTIGERLIQGAAVISASLAASKHKPSDDSVAFVQLAYGLVSDHYFLLFIGFMSLWLVGSILRWWGHDQKSLDQLQQIMDAMQCGIFPKGNHLARNRVTLFRWQRFLPRIRHHGQYVLPWSGWLVPIVRSGHTSQTSDAVFMARQATDKAEGIAGRSWATRSNVLVTNLPQPTLADTEGIQAYAEGSFIPESFLRARLLERKAISRSFLAIPVESRGRISGVIVIDSVEPFAVTNRTPGKFDFIVPLVGTLMERVK